MGLSEMRANALMGAPILSGPNSGKALMYLPSLSAAPARISFAVTTPCPPLPCHLISTVRHVKHLTPAFPETNDIFEDFTELFYETR